MYSFTEDFLRNKIFLAVATAGIISQALKILVIRLKLKQRFHLHSLIVTGGMPSAHSALVSSLSTIILLREGVTSLFFVTLTFALIVLRDAMGVRRSVGEEGKFIEKLLRYEKMKVDKFHYSLGHTPIQVLAGLLIGILSAIGVYYY